MHRKQKETKRNEKESKTQQNNTKQSYTTTLELSVRRSPYFALKGDDKTLHNLKIGSSARGRHPLSGLTHEEERMYLPYIIGTSPQDPQWNMHVRDYWSNISVKVPADGIGTEKLQGRLMKFTIEFDNKADKEAFEGSYNFEEQGELSKKGRVIDGTDDYILFRYCLVYSRVANSFKDVGKSAKIWFYLFSLKNEAKASHLAMKEQLAAQEKFIEVLKNEKMVDALLLVFEQNIYELESLEDKHLALKSLLDAKPKEFLAHATNRFLGTKATIRKCVNAGIIDNPANTDSYYYGENREVLLGRNIDEVIMYFNSKNPEEVNVVTAIKARLSNL